MKDRMGFAPVAWPQTADALGFSAPDARGVRALNGFAIRSEGHWLALVDRGNLPAAPLASGLGQPGLWRVVGNGEDLERVHDLPQLRGKVDGLGAEEDPSGPALAPLVEWAAETRSGRLDPTWTPPPLEEVESWLTPARLRVRSGSLPAKGELVHEPQRLALVFPALATVPEDLSPARRSWLDALLLDAHRRWRLARFGVHPASRSVQAEVDLTGVPVGWAQALLQLALEALAWAVEWVLSPISFLVDPSASNRALERHTYPSLNRSNSK